MENATTPIQVESSTTENHEVLKDSQYIPIVVVGTLSSTLSIIGSVCIVYVTSHQLNQIKQRLLLSLSLADVVSSMACLLMPFAIPSFVGLPGAVGNHASCAAAGFFLFLANKVGAIYNTYLSLYFLALVRWNYREQHFKKWAEIVAHVMAVTIPLSIDVAAVATQTINPLPGIDNICAYSAYPADCVDDDCERSTQRTHLILLRIIGPMVLIISLVGFVSTGMVWWTARNRFHASRKYQFERSVSGAAPSTLHSSSLDASQVSRRTATCTASLASDANDKHLRQVGIQAVLYSIAYLNPFIWPVVATVNTSLSTPGEVAQKDYFVWRLLFWIFFPLQGACNFLVYTRISVQRWRRAEPDASLFWIYRQIVSCAPFPNAARRSTVNQTTRGSAVRLPQEMEQPQSVVDTTGKELSSEEPVGEGQHQDVSA